jgi:hypothetical protein
MKCPQCGKEVRRVIVEERSFHRVDFDVTGVRRRVRWNVDGETLGLIILHREGDEVCTFTPADDEHLLELLAGWLLSEEDYIDPAIEHLFAEKSEVSSNVEGK